MIEQESAMQKAFRELLYIAQNMQLALSEIILENNLGQHNHSVGKMAKQIERLLNLLSTAKDHHKISLIDEKFLIPLLDDVEQQVLESVLSQLGKETSSKVLRVALKRLMDEI